MFHFRNELDKDKYFSYQLNKAIENKELRIVKYQNLIINIILYFHNINTPFYVF